MIRNLSAHPTQLLNSTISKFRCFSYMVIALYNLNILLSLQLLSDPTCSKFYQPTNWNFFGLIIPLNFYLEIGRNYVSIITTIISNIIVLVSHNAICFGYFIPMNHAVSKKAPPIVSPTLLPYQAFTRFAYCFTRNNLSIFFCSDQIIAKNNA